jgi:tetratricopeptide (TPR) repeat protein
MPIDILDFQFTKASDLYQLNVFKRDSAQPLASATLDIPSGYRSKFDLDLLDFDPKDPAGRVDRITAFGSRLYQKVFTTEITRVWSEHKKKANELSVLCIRIALEASELEAIPWETLYDGEEFLAAGAGSTISRLPLDVQSLGERPPVPAPLRLLALISSPLDLPEHSRLQMEREQEILLEAINDPSGQGRLQIEFEEEVKLEILDSDLETPYQILHFSGHGIAAEAGGGLLLEDARGNSRPTSVADVMQSLQRGERSLRLVVLSGCQTARTLDIAGLRDMARGLLRRGIPSVIAMQFSISDHGGLKFAEEFYSRIAVGRPVEMAIHSARRALIVSDNQYLKADALASVLLTASGDCLKTTQGTQDPTIGLPKLDTAVFLPLAQLSHAFYGRRSEYRQVRDAILQRNQRAVIIHGIGGIGKTALVSHTAKRLRRHFQGVFAFDCSSGTLAPETAMLELHRYFESQGVKALEQLLFSKLAPAVLANYLGQLLSQWSLLLIFDNFESLLERTGDNFHIRDQDLRTFITTLVKTTATRSHFLFTSRYLFELDDRRLGPIESVHLRDLSRPEALSLMQKLPQLGRASHEEKLKALQTFGGHPYALVTLDRHCGHRPLDQALADAKEIHAELREFLAIELNYAQLSDRARELLTGLAAFRQAVPYDAAEWVLGERVPIPPELLEKMKRAITEHPELDDITFADLMKWLPERRQANNVDRAIRELVDWGLLTPIHENDEVTRLSVHALVREFCHDKQTNDIWCGRVRDAAAYYTNKTKTIKKEDKSPAAVWVEMEAFELLMEIGDYQDAARLLIGATKLLARWGFVHYLDNQHRRLLDVLDPHETAVVLHNFAYLLQSRGDYEQALGYYQRALKINEELGDQDSVASSLHQIGIIQQLRGDYEQALQYYQRSLKIKEELGNREGVANSLGQIGVIQQLRGEYQQAFEYYQSALKIDEELGNRAGMASSLHQIGTIQQERGDYEQAQEYYQQSLKIEEELGNRLGVASSLGQIGRLLTEIGRYAEALDHLLPALSTFLELQSPNARIVVSNLKALRDKWGEESFDAAWKKETEMDVPDWLSSEVT